jgi:hypothetical protein
MAKNKQRAGQSFAVNGALGRGIRWPRPQQGPGAAARVSARVSGKARAAEEAREVRQQPDEQSCARAVTLAEDEQKRERERVPPQEQENEQEEHEEQEPPTEPQATKQQQRPAGGTDMFGLPLMRTCLVTKTIVIILTTSSPGSSPTRPTS